MKQTATELGVVWVRVWMRSVNLWQTAEVNTKYQSTREKRQKKKKMCVTELPFWIF